MSKLISILGLLIFLYVPSSVKADPLVLLNFDEAVRPEDLYRSQGVILTTILISNVDGSVTGSINDIVLRASPSAVSPPQGAFAVNIANPQFAGINGISGEFKFTVEGLEVPGATQLVKFNVIGSQGTWKVLFFDTTNTSFPDLQTGLVGTFTGNSDQQIVFAWPAGIRRFVFIPSVLNGPTGIDNLEFEPTFVPEPASIFLMTLGIGAMLAHKRRQRINRQ